MSRLKKEDVAHVATLCRIHVEEDEQEALASDLSKILDHIDELSKVDTQGVEPCNHVLEEMVNVLREDEVKETLLREDFLSIAPDQVGGMIRVPPVIKRSKS